MTNYDGVTSMFSEITRSWEVWDICFGNLVFVVFDFIQFFFWIKEAFSNSICIFRQAFLSLHLRMSERTVSIRLRTWQEKNKTKQSDSIKNVWMSTKYQYNQIYTVSYLFSFPSPCISLIWWEFTAYEGQCLSISQVVEHHYHEV